MIEEFVCRSWLEIQEHLYDASWDPTLERYRSSFAFRGMPDRNFTLQTSLQNMGGAFEQVEMHLIRNFIKYAYEHVAATNPGIALSPNGNSPWYWLVLARHHGLPTRLLDWTYSPYVALHFATETLANEQIPADAVIWCVDYKQTQDLLPNWLQEVLNNEESDVFTIEMLSMVARDIPTFDHRIREGQNKKGGEDCLLFFEPPSLDARVVNQFALHTMMSNASTRVDEWLDLHPELCRKIIIPARLKWEVRDKLDQANINERLLYPGLDGLCQWLRRYYGPRAPFSKKKVEQECMNQRR